MTVRNDHARLTSHQSVGPLAWTAQLFATLWYQTEALYARYRNREGVRDMLKLDDHILRDMGVTRYDVHRAANLPLSYRAGEELARAAGRRRTRRR